LIKNFISGIIVLFERKIRVGDIVDVGGMSGSVTEINTRSSVLRGGDGKETLVPNSYFLENRVTNLTLSNRRVRRTLSVGVVYGSEVSLVLATLKECVERHGLILKDPAPIVTLDDFGDKALVFMLYFWTEFNDKTNGDVVSSDIRLMIEKRFTELGITLAGADQELAVRMALPPDMDWPQRTTAP
ncbi:MAG: mechanosensitive ion channel, partial [Verrucomicrobiaceae bacterium]